MAHLILFSVLNPNNPLISSVFKRCFLFGGAPLFYLFLLLKTMGFLFILSLFVEINLFFNKKERYLMDFVVVFS
jgi:hypothetical protein